MSGNQEVEYLKKLKTELGDLFKLIEEGDSEKLESAFEGGWGRRMKMYFSAASVVNLFATFIPPVGLCAAPFFLTGALWNAMDTAGGMSEGKEAYQEAHEHKRHVGERKFWGAANYTAGLGMIGLTGWSVVETIKNASPSFLAFGKVAGIASSSFAFANFSFAAAMFVAMGETIRKAERARKKKNPVYLLEDRLIKFEKLNQKPNSNKKEIR